jgi:hypothetical protein
MYEAHHVRPVSRDHPVRREPARNRPGRQAGHDRRREPRQGGGPRKASAHERRARQGGRRSSLSKADRAELYTKLFVPINLNTATDEEILLIPMVGNRMLKEFKEYRPYTALAQFHREIGKYVDNTELARLEQYVFVPLKK